MSCFVFTHPEENSKKRQVELSRATLELSFNSPNNYSGQNIKKCLSMQILGLRKLGSDKSLVQNKIVGPKKVLVQTNLGPN